LAGLDIAGEIPEERVPRSTVRSRPNLTRPALAGGVGNLAARRRYSLSPASRRASRDVNKGRDLGINPGLADDRFPAQEWPTSTVGPSCNGKNAGAWPRWSSASEVNGFCNRRRLQTGELKASDDLGPAGTVRIGAMDPGRHCG